MTIGSVVHDSSPGWIAGFILVDHFPENTISVRPLLFDPKGSAPGIVASTRLYFDPVVKIIANVRGWRDPIYYIISPPYLLRFAYGPDNRSGIP